MPLNKETKPNQTKPTMGKIDLFENCLYLIELNAT